MATICWDLAKFAQELRGITKGDGVTTTVPIKGGGSKPGVGDYVTWNAPRAKALFTALREDRPVPKG